MHKVNLLSSESRASNLFEYYAESRQQMHKVNLLSSEGRASNLFEYYAESRQQMHKVNLLSSESRASNLFEYYAESRQQMFKVNLLSSNYMKKIINLLFMSLVSATVSAQSAGFVYGQIPSLPQTFAYLSGDTIAINRFSQIIFELQEQCNKEILKLEKESEQNKDAISDAATAQGGLTTKEGKTLSHNPTAATAGQITKNITGMNVAELEKMAAQMEDLSEKEQEAMAMQIYAKTKPRTQKISVAYIQYLENTKSGQARCAELKATADNALEELEKQAKTISDKQQIGKWLREYTTLMGYTDAQSVAKAAEYKSKYDAARKEYIAQITPYAESYYGTLKAYCHKVITIMDEQIAECYKLINAKDPTPNVLLQEHIRGHKIVQYYQIKEQLSDIQKIDRLYSDASPIELM